MSRALAVTTGVALLSSEGRARPLAVAGLAKAPGRAAELLQRRFNTGNSNTDNDIFFECDEGTNFITGVEYTQQAVCGSVATVLEGCQAECERIERTAFFYQEHPNNVGCSCSPSGGYQICGFTTAGDFGTTRRSWPRSGSQVCRRLTSSSTGEDVDEMIDFDDEDVETDEDVDEMIDFGDEAGRSGRETDNWVCGGDSGKKPCIDNFDEVYTGDMHGNSVGRNNKRYVSGLGTAADVDRRCTKVCKEDDRCEFWVRSTNANSKRQVACWKKN